jgi:hypothetical protein
MLTELYFITNERDQLRFSRIADRVQDNNLGVPPETP